MKTKVIVLVLALAVFFSVPAAAKSFSKDGISLTFPDEYLVITPELIDEHPEIAESFEGQTDKSLKAHMEGNGILYLAIEKGEVRQIQFRAEKGAEGSFAEKVGDLSLLSNESIKDSAGEMALVIQQKTNSKVAEDYRVVMSQSGIKAIRFELLSNETDYACVQYVTIRNGYIYSLTGYDSPGSDAAFLGDIFDTLSIEKESKPITVAQGNQWLTTVITVLLILVAAAVIIRVIITFVYDFKNRDNDVREFVKIKRRKF